MTLPLSVFIACPTKTLIDTKICGHLLIFREISSSCSTGHLVAGFYSLLHVNNWPWLMAMYLFIFFYRGSFLQNMQLSEQHKSSAWPSNKYTHKYNLSVKQLQKKRSANPQYLLGETVVSKFFSIKIEALYGSSAASREVFSPFILHLPWTIIG